MKSLSLLLTILFCAMSCRDNSTDKKQTESAEKTETTFEDNESLYYKMADIELESSAEKIALLSTIKGFPIEKSQSVLRDYVAKSWRNQFSDDPSFYLKVMDTVAGMNDLSLKETAAIIFAFRYEMVTEEILDQREDLDLRDDYEFSDRY